MVLAQFQNLGEPKRLGYERKGGSCVVPLAGVVTKTKAAKVGVSSTAKYDVIVRGCCFQLFPLRRECCQGYCLSVFSKDARRMEVLKEKKERVIWEKLHVLPVSGNSPHVSHCGD